MADIQFFAPDTDAYVSSVQNHIHEFEEASGHKVRLNIIGSDHYFSNQIHNFLEGEDPADVYMSGPVLLWAHVKAGFVEPLDNYLQNAKDSYQPEDFLEPLMKSNRWSGRFGEKLGSGPLLEIPVNCESYNLAYVPEILDQSGSPVPTTWDEFFRTAAHITTNSNPTVRGFGQRGIYVWHTMYTGYATQFWSYGAVDFDETGHCAIASPAGIKATQDFIEGLKSAGPRNWTQQRWFELAMDFAQGQYGLLVDSDHYVAFFENPELSKLNGKIGYALPPKGPTGLQKPNLWTWSVVMNARSKNKRAAWDFIEWATSQEFLLRSTFEGNMNPTRLSIWNDSRFMEFTGDWGDFYMVSKKLVSDLGQVLVTPAGNYLDVATRWTQALIEAYDGTKSVRDALEHAAQDIDLLVQK